MRTKKNIQRVNNLLKFKIEKEEAFQLEGGPELDRGTVTTPVDVD